MSAVALNNPDKALFTSGERLALQTLTVIATLTIAVAITYFADPNAGHALLQFARTGTGGLLLGIGIPLVTGIIVGIMDHYSDPSTTRLPLGERRDAPLQ